MIMRNQIHVCEERRHKTSVGKHQELFTHETPGRAVREDGVVSEHSLGSLLLDTANRGGFLPQHLVQVLHDLQLLSPLILLPSEVSSALGGPLYWWGA